MVRHFLQRLMSRLLVLWNASIYEGASGILGTIKYATCMCLISARTSNRCLRMEERYPHMGLSVYHVSNAFLRVSPLAAGGPTRSGSHRIRVNGRFRGVRCGCDYAWRGTVAQPDFLGASVLSLTEAKVEA